MTILDRKYNLAVRVSKAFNESGIKSKLVRGEVDSKAHRQTNESNLLASLTSGLQIKP